MGKLLKQHPGDRGHLWVSLHKNGIKKTFKIHRLVAIVFIGPIPPNHVVHHIDGIVANNHYLNLKIMKRGLHASDHNKGNGNGRVKLTPDQIKEIRNIPVEVHKRGGNNYRNIGKRFGVTGEQISNIKRQKLWKHL